MIQRGLFLTVEGIEGVGKSTNVEFLSTRLTALGVDLVVTREPGGTSVAEAIRETLLQQHAEPVSAMAELLLVFAARAQHIEQLIEPALRAGRWVLCDRFTDATYAYQGGGRGMDRGLIRQLEELTQGDLRPVYTVLLDAPVDTGMARARARGELDRFEREHLDFFERVREAYLGQARSSSGRYHLVDATRPLQEVQAQLEVLCSDLLACWEVRHGED